MSKSAFDELGKRLQDPEELTKFVIVFANRVVSSEAQQKFVATLQVALSKSPGAATSDEAWNAARDEAVRVTRSSMDAYAMAYGGPAWTELWGALEASMIESSNEVRKSLLDTREEPNTN